MRLPTITSVDTVTTDRLTLACLPTATLDEVKFARRAHDSAVARGMEVKPFALNPNRHVAQCDNANLWCDVRARDARLQLIAHSARDLGLILCYLAVSGDSVDRATVRAARRYFKGEVILDIDVVCPSSLNPIATFWTLLGRHDLHRVDCMRTDTFLSSAWDRLDPGHRSDLILAFQASSMVLLADYFSSLDLLTDKEVA